MLRLSRQSWNNLIIFGVLALFFLFYIAPSHLAFMLNRDAAVTMLAPGQRILQLQFPQATLKQAGPVWRFEPQHSAVAPDTLLQQWQQFVLPAPQQAGNQILAQVCQVRLFQSGEAEPTLWQFVLDQQQWYLQTQQWLFLSLRPQQISCARRLYVNPELLCLELPEVEVSRLGITPHLSNRTIRRIDVRQPMLRWPVPAEVITLTNAPVLSVSRRAKYLLIEVPGGSIILHLGMSGNLKILSADTPAGKHDHVDIVLDNNTLLRLNDTRRFGAVLWQASDTEHPLLTTLGPEPLTSAFDAQQLYQHCQKRSSAIKLVLMDNHVVVGVGNIYANESLFKAGILPTKPANQLTMAQCAVLVEVVKQILAQAITQGGTTLKDFSQADGKPGYFKQELLVYGRGGQPCVSCDSELEEIRLGQRSTVFCRHCQA